LKWLFAAANRGSRPPRPETGGTATATITSSAALALPEPVFSDQERLALAGFLAGYYGMTREAYALDLRQLAPWCHPHQLRLFAARPAYIECLPNLQPPRVI
jgi:hypothetical protein